ncbi:unnamed protein product [Adineta steineri]|uniref:Uncharacterized protein n=1 Tax=Adineta steineri TaxID=433720 RepID=A0A815EMY5_9BILA|nr:unnamed protein product [Adineta steineri]
MSSSRQPSNNHNNNNSSYQNQLLDYETDESLNTQAMSDHLFDNRTQSYENGLFQQMYPFQEDEDANLPDEIVAELDARDHHHHRHHQIRTNVNHDEDDSVFSDAVQDAFKKYQNEQEELYAQMEECWNYMAQETEFTDTPKVSAEQPEDSKLNPDANEFKPSWLKPSTTEGPLVTLTSSSSPSSSQLDKQEKKF